MKQNNLGPTSHTIKLFWDCYSFLELKRVAEKSEFLMFWPFEQYLNKPY